ncbi:hypothetical protein HYDPIDRAFT_23777 [Hydnomerulius pinastri MD-312]|nr:hypothetical protein HYDPIDRAFT_23777 [Hydnomerulius pinastri MD-312]
MASYYDSSSSSTSSSPPSPPAQRHRLRRKRSPSPSSRHVSQPYSANPFSSNYMSSRPYSPSTREADVARLLDPAYASPNAHSAHKSSKTAVREVYVDNHGDLHDPDFRHFPTFGHTHTQSQRPRWEQGYGDEDDSDDEEYEVEQKRSSFEAQRRRPSSSMAYYTAPAYYPYEEPSSYESRFLAEDEGEELDHHERAPLKEKCFRSRSKSPEKRHGSQNEKQSRPTSEDDQQVIEGDSDWTPTCSQSLRRQWQAIVLSLRFSLFRTKRRLRRRVTG